jgi:protein involved in polysaccharide export with SLBB domain
MFDTVRRRQAPVAALLLTLGLAGCSAVAKQAIPAHCVSPSVPDTPRASKEPINFARLTQDPPQAYLVGPRDILGIYVEGVLGKVDEPPPVHFPEREEENLPPAIGYPIPVRDDGTISLPLVPPIRVGGLTLTQAEEDLRAAYTIRNHILQPGKERILVTVIRPRTSSVLVIREDSSSMSMGGAGGQSQGRIGQETLGSRKFGATYLVELPAYQNDVLHALSKAGGLPGLDARNELLILRGGFQNAEDRDRLLGAAKDRDAWQWVNNPNVKKIPLRVGPDDPPVQLTPADIILNTGDIVYIRSREAEVFYTGGLLSGGQFPIPRDYDLDVLGAMAMAGGGAASAPGSSRMGVGGSGSFNGALFPPTRVIVLRTVNGQQVPIKLDVTNAFLNSRERILIQPNDYILLEYTELELAMNTFLSAFQFNYLLNTVH